MATHMGNIMEKMKEQVYREDTYSYRGWLVSDKFWKRFLAFTGYTYVALMVLALIYDVLRGLVF